MNRDDSYFYISGFLALSIFVFFLVLFSFMMSLSDKVKNFALVKDNYISVSVELKKAQSKSAEKTVDKPAVKEEVVKTVDKPAVKDEVVKTETKEVDIDNLFSEVWTKSIKQSKEVIKEPNIRRLQTIQKKIKTSENNKVESMSEKFQHIDTSKVDNKNSKSSTATEVNEYLAKIQALVYEHFYPPQNSQGNSVRAVIVLSSIGKVQDFRILSYSTNSELNSECDKIKARLLNVVFPENPDNVSGTYTITLTSKE